MASSQGYPTVETRIASSTQHEDQDLLASEPNLWPPLKVIREHRRRAHLLWGTMLVVFFAYVAYVITDTVHDRRNPASSIGVVKEYFKFPDVALCVGEGRGCRVHGSSCFDPDVSSLVPVSLLGFLESTEDLQELQQSEANLAIEAAYPSCKVVPLSMLTVNETGVEDGYHTHFYVKLYASWFEDPTFTSELTSSDIARHTTVFFIDVDQSIEGIGEEIVDAKLPYAVRTLVSGEEVIIPMNNMILTMDEFTGLTADGSNARAERTFHQTTTTASDVWYWDGETYEGVEISLMYLEMMIGKFEYTKIKEIDPVDPWAIIGAIGGVWQIICVGFGAFFVFSVKQAPDRKLRNLEKSVRTPALLIGRRLSTTSSRISQQSREVDALDEDLPPGWVKLQREDNSMYYYNTSTGAAQDASPNDMLRGGSGVSEFTPAHSARTSGHTSLLGRAPRGSEQNAGSHVNEDSSLPQGWVAKVDGEGRTYYMDTVQKTTQWEHPKPRKASVNSFQHSSHNQRKVKVVDNPMRRSQEPAGETRTLYDNTNDGEDINTTGSTVGVSTGVEPWVPKTPPKASKRSSVNNERMPPGWKESRTKSGKIFYANSITKITQWDRPQN